MFEDYLFDQVRNGEASLEEVGMSEERYAELLAEKASFDARKQTAIYQASLAAEKAAKEEREAFLSSMTEEERDEYFWGCRVLNFRDDLN